MFKKKYKKIVLLREIIFSLLDYFFIEKMKGNVLLFYSSYKWNIIKF